MQTIGERLEEARKKKGISIREAAEATKIRGDYLQKFESNQFDIGLTEIYTRGFLRTYATFLKVPADRVMSDYAALGRGDVRPRQPNREVYGRMDISVASTHDAADRGATAPETVSPEAAATARSQPRFPRGTGSSLPTGPDPAVLFKWFKIGGAVLGILVILVVINALLSGRRSSTPPANTHPATAASAPSSTEPSVGLVALGTVQVTVYKKNADGSYGDVLFDGVVLPGDTKVVPRRGALYIKAIPPENLNVEVNGVRYPMRLPAGMNVGELAAPPAR